MPIRNNVQFCKSPATHSQLCVIFKKSKDWGSLFPSFVSEYLRMMGGGGGVIRHDGLMRKAAHCRVIGPGSVYMCEVLEKILPAVPTFRIARRWKQASLPSLGEHTNKW